MPLWRPGRMDEKPTWKPFPPCHGLPGNAEECGRWGTNGARHLAPPTMQCPCVFITLHDLCHRPSARLRIPPSPRPRRLVMSRPPPLVSVPAHRAGPTGPGEPEASAPRRPRPAGPPEARGWLRPYPRTPARGAPAAGAGLGTSPGGGPASSIRAPPGLAVTAPPSPIRTSDTRSSGYRVRRPYIEHYTRHVT